LKVHNPTERNGGTGDANPNLAARTILPLIDKIVSAGGENPGPVSESLTKDLLSPMTLVSVHFAFRPIPAVSACAKRQLSVPGIGHCGGGVRA
jgi:hypothetical protein